MRIYARHPERKKYSGRDCMVGHLDVSDKLRLSALREAANNADSEYQEFAAKLVEKVKKEEKNDIVDAGGDFKTVEVDFYKGTKYLVSWYTFSLKVTREKIKVSKRSKVSKLSKKMRKSRKEKK